MSEKKLKMKPCPFCGASIHVKIYTFRNLDFLPMHYIVCEAEGCPANRALTFADKEDAIAAWNRRKA